MARFVFLIAGWFLLASASVGGAAENTKVSQPISTARPQQEIDFARDVRPILSANCFPCHGPDEAARKADLRLDQRASAIADGAIMPGNVQASLLAERIAATDLDMRMPPADSGLSLNQEQVELLKRWINEGAEYRGHWAFIPPKRLNPPADANKNWPVNDIDFFILRGLEEAHLEPAQQATPHIMVRRIFLDLTGLPPSPEVADQFAANPSRAAYERLVDDLLSSPQFGEHWARIWLDLARYADTKGYEKDFPRDVWPYRDWVIRALNDDMPFDQFTIEQLAGDLLPNPSRAELTATVFHRNTMSNDEGGTDDEEFRIAAVKDRVDTTMQVWMGLTAGCAKCHSHKFDPISHQEYYQLFAIFNQTADSDKFDDAPIMRFESPEQVEQLKDLRGQAAELSNEIERSRDDRPRANIESGATPIARSGFVDSSEIKQDDSDLETELKAKTAKLNRRLQQLEENIPKLPIMRELTGAQRRVTHINLRGNFLDKGVEVFPAVPTEFGSFSNDRPHDRLALAKWLVSPENPLTARVAVNRIWARFFGVGLVETEGDFGTQGAPPSHPLLLDWLACEFRDTHHWSLKKMCKTIVMSATYLQSSVTDGSKLDVDPQNRLISRGPSFRLPAETVRDQALSVAGLLSKKMYGPPVMPPQPVGVWKSIYNVRKWQTSEGEDRYRRAIYNYWKRTSPYPSMMIFDADSREVCSIRRLNTNTPLQALVLMNDPVYLEAAGALAKRMIDEGGETANNRIKRGLRMVVIRPPVTREVARLDELRIAAEQKFAAHPDDAARLLEVCNATHFAAGVLTTEKFASYVVVASVLLNLDEAVTNN